MKKLKLYPYRKQLPGLGNVWVFDDERTGLKEEAFVPNATSMLDRVVYGIKRFPETAEKGFTLTFSDELFEGKDVSLFWLEQDENGYGNWYAANLDGQYQECWLCPALFKYFEAAPEIIYLKVDPLEDGVDPIWKAGKRTELWNA